MTRKITKSNQSEQRSDRGAKRSDRGGAYSGAPALHPYAPIGVSLANSSYSLSQTRTCGYPVWGVSSFHLRITVSVVQVLRFVRYRLYFLTKINQMVY